MVAQAAKAMKLDEATCRRICEGLNIEPDRFRMTGLALFPEETRWTGGRAPAWRIVQRAAEGDAMAERPVRLQLSRRKGFNLQALSVATNGLPAVNCARPGRWGNPYATAEQYRSAFRDDPRLGLGFLRGKNLACWCPRDQACHADVLLELANG